MKMKKQAQYTFDLFNNELTELYNFLKSSNVSDGEIKQVFAPLMKNKRKTNFGVSEKIITLLATIILSLYVLSYFETISWHYSAIGRIAMIKLLPYWDWTNLKNKQCLVEKFGSSKTNTFFNCDLCENINKIDVYSTIEPDHLIRNYLEVHVPVIITDGLHHWPKNSTFINNLIGNDIFYGSIPCSLSTNIYGGIENTGKILERAKNFDTFFIHFQNCDIDAMKEFRRFTYRPKFLPDIYSPVLYNWLLWSNSYNISSFKNIDLIEKVTVVGQILGSTYLKLTPRMNCEEDCPILNIHLAEGEALVLTSMWNMSYRPNENGENVAAILETRD